MHTNVEKITPYGGDENKGAQIEQAFDHIAPRYDFMNRLLSMGIDITWRRRALRSISNAPSSILDLATGTGDLIIMEAETFPEAMITGIDLSRKMLSIAKSKAEKNKFSDRINFIQGNCLEMPFEDNSFDVATIAFGIRNFESIVAGYKEMLRVLKPGGELVVLELSRPQTKILSAFYSFYLTKVTPALGSFFTGNRKEYRYLPESINCVPQGKEMLALLRDADFRECRFQTYTFGICSCYTAVKDKEFV